MDKYFIRFKIDDFNKIIIKLEEPIDKVHCCYEVPIAVTHNNMVIDFSIHSVREVLQDLKLFAERLSHNKLKLHESINKDIGFLLNEELQEKPGLFMKQENGRESWIGYDYLPLLGYGVALWLYNVSNDMIRFEVTPRFPFSYRNYEKNPNYIPYRKWIKGYKPLFIVETSREHVQKWAPVATFLLEQIEENIKKLHEE